MSKQPKQTSTETEERDDAVIAQAFRRSLIAIVMLAIVIAGAVWYLNRPGEKEQLQQSELDKAKVRTASKVEPPSLLWSDITSDATIAFTHANGAYGEKLLPETMGGGVALFDFDGDGDQDLLLINSCDWPWHAGDASAAKPTMALYRNDSTPQRIHFTDVTVGSGFDVCFYGMGVAVGDYDNDGRVDVFITAVGSNHLFRNLGDGKFADVTTQAKVAGGQDQWSTSCAFFDYDNDGDLDLFVCNYIRWSREIDAAQNFQLIGVGRAYGPPTAFEGAFSYLYRNDGDHFADVSAEAGIHVINPATKVPVGKALGVAPVDVDGDGYLDLIIANDTVQNFLFHNIPGKDGQRGFEEIGGVTGVAFDPMGKARGAMGIDAACFRNDATLGIVIGNFANEMSALYVAKKLPGSGTILFTDDAASTGFGPPGRLDLKFGTFFFDADLDGRLDVLHANGHLEDEINKVQSSQHYRQAARLMWNAGPQSASEFITMSPAKTGDDLLKPIVGRGAAYGDLDGDGDLDVILTQTGGSPLVLRNDQQLGHHFIRIKLTGDPAKKTNRDAIGAWIEVKAGDQTMRRQVMPARSYLSQVELPVTIGLGKAKSIEQITVTWPGGATTVMKDVKLDSTISIKQ